MQLNYLKNLTLILFLLLIISPSLFFYPFGSLSYGLIIFSFGLVSYTLIFHNNLPDIYINFFFKIYFVIFFLIILHFLVTTLFVLNINYVRFFLSNIALMVFFFASLIFATFLIKIYKNNFFDSLLKIIFYIILFLCFLGILRYSTFSPFYYDTNIYLTIFAEPSHLVITILPFISYFIMSSKNLKSKIKLIFLFLTISILLKSATLMIAMIIFSLLFFSLKQLLHLLLFLIFVALIIYILELNEIIAPLIGIEYFLERFSLNSFGEGGKVNLSVLVFLAGYHEVYLNLKDTFFLGIGFQQFGFLGQQSFIRDLIYVFSGTFEYSANRDSSFLFGKYISEFGVFGIISILYYLKYFIRSLVYVKKNVPKKNNLNLFFSACIISFSIELFLRGAGYFTVSTFLFLVSIFGQILLKYYDKKN